MSKKTSEPFADFAKLAEGIPSLIYYQNRTTAHVHWGDGSMWHYVEFSSALDKDGMSRDLHEVFQRHIKEGAVRSKRTALTYGGVHGCIVYAPTALAVEIRDIVRDHFVRALGLVAARIREGDMEPADKW